MSRPAGWPGRCWPGHWRGLVSIAYVRLIAWADGHKPMGLRLHGARLLLVPLAVFTALGCLAIPFPHLLGNGKDVVQLALDSKLGLGLLVALVILKPLATAACLGSGAPGGLFTPTITLGALLGGLLGVIWAHIWPGTPPGFCALIGAGAVLAAATQGPVSAMALMIELTRRMDVTMVPMLLAVVGATAVARRLEVRSIYSGRIHAGRAATGPKQKQAEDEGTFEVLSAAAPYAEVLHTLLRIGDEPKPIQVIDEHGEAVGTIARDEAIAPDRSVAPLAIATAADFASAPSGPGT
jgi:chloride channel protein, CIC family